MQPAEVEIAQRWTAAPQAVASAPAGSWPGGLPSSRRDAGAGPVGAARVQGTRSLFARLPDRGQAETAGDAAWECGVPVANCRRIRE